MAVTTNNKILPTEAGYQNVSRIEGDTLTGTVLQNKQQFDAYPNLIKDHFNDLVDELVVELDNKIDKVGNKGLSTNDYTTAEKNKLAGIASGAEANVQADWNETNTNSDAYIKNKPTIADTVAAGSGLSKNGNTINHSNSVTAGTIGSTSDTSGSSIAIPYATYDAQGHITGKGTRTHSVGLSNGTTNGWTWIRYGDYIVCWTGEQGLVFTNGAAHISYPFRLTNDTTAYSKPIVLTAFSYDPNAIVSNGATITTQPQGSGANLYLRNASGAVSGTYNLNIVVIGKVDE